MVCEKFCYQKPFGRMILCHTVVRLGSYRLLESSFAFRWSKMTLNPHKSSFADAINHFMMRTLKYFWWDADFLFDDERRFKMLAQRLNWLAYLRTDRALCKSHFQRNPGDAGHFFVSHFLVNYSAHRIPRPRRIQWSFGRSSCCFSSMPLF